MGETFYIGRERLEMMRLEQRRREAMAYVPKVKAPAESTVSGEFMPPSEGGPMAVAMALLTYHAGFEACLVSTIKAHAQKLGISLATLKRAKKAVGLTTIEREDGFYWGLSGGVNP
jgi:hypothetical protein